MNIRRFTLICLLVVVAALVYLSGRSGAQVAVEIRPVVITYSLVSSASATSAPVLATTEILGVRADGSNSKARLIPSLVGTSHPYNLKITDTANGVHIVVDQVTKSKTTYATRNIVDQYRINPINSCPGSPGETILGYRTLLEEQSVAFPTGASRNRRVWRAPELSCLILREESGSANATSKGGKTILAATRVVLADPEPWMFEVPADYSERSPAEVLGEAARIRGKPAPRAPDGLEQVYKGSQRPPK